MVPEVSTRLLVFAVESLALCPLFFDVRVDRLRLPARRPGGRRLSSAPGAVVTPGR
jgi:hypothetical protein